MILLGAVGFLNDATAQSELPPRDSSRILFAERGARFRYYLPGTKLRVTAYQSREKTKGWIVFVTDSILLMRTRRNEVAIPIDSIVAIKKVDPTLRVVFASAGAVAITGSFLLAQRATSVGALLLIPVAAGGIYSVSGIPLSYLIESFEEKKAKRQWRFRAVPRYIWMKKRML